jgi:sugar phosphate isomerase/epimerase
VLFGAHVSSAGGISNAIDRIEEIGGSAVQVFTQSPRMWKATEHAAEEVERFRTRRKQARVKAVACHALYLVNLASRDKEVRSKSFTAMCSTMQTARALGADSVVFHPGSHLGYGLDDALRVLTPALRDLLELTTDDLWLCVENTAGAGGTIGRSIDELAALYGALDGHRRLGVCIDSCHWWASGRPNRHRADPLPARERRGRAARRQPRPARGRRRRADRERPRNLSRAPRVRRPPRDSRDVAERRAFHRRHRRATQAAPARQAPVEGPQAPGREL